MGLNKWDEVLKPGSKIAIGARFKHDSPDIANRRVKVYYEFFYYRLGGHNWYENPYTTGKATVNGVVKYHNTKQLVNLYHQTRHTVHSGNVWVSYVSSTTKSMPYKFEHDGKIVPPIDASIIISGNYTLPTIGGTSTPKPPTNPDKKYATLSSVPTTLRVGQTYTVSVKSNSSSYTHSLSLSIDSEYNAVSSRSTATKITFTVPESSRFGTKEYLRGLLMLHTYNSSGTYLSGDSYSRNVYPKPKPPTSSGVSIADGSSASNIFSSNNQVLMGLSNLTATVSGAKAVASGASINQYEVTLKNSAGTTRMKATSSSSTVELGTPNYSLTGSEVLDAHIRVRDTNGEWSSVNKKTSILRVHRYSSPSGNGSVTRNGTSVNVKYNWNVSSLKESGSTERNSAKIIVQSKTTNSTSWSSKDTYDNTKLSGNRSLNLSGYDTVQGYDFRIRVKDGVTQTYINIGSIGTEAVPLDLSKGGAGVGKIHSGSGAHLQVGSGGIDSEGKIRENGVIVSEGRHYNYKTFTVGGNANSYYPVIISSQAQFGFHRYSISRGYNWAAPNTWNTSTHRGGLTFDFEWSGDTAWGGNDKSIRVIEWNETYTTMVGGLGLGRSGGLIVWLRGGGAQYRFRSERGQYASLEVRLDGFTDASGTSFPVRTSPVASEINNRYPVRGAASLYDNGNKLWSAGNDGSGSGLDADKLDGLHASSFAKVGDIPTIPSIPKAYSPTWGGSGNNRWLRFPSGHQICWGSTTTTNSSASVTYPRGFTSTPMITVTGAYASFSPSTTVSSASKTAATFYIVDGRNGGLWGGSYTSGKSATLRYIAVGIG